MRITFRFSLRTLLGIVTVPCFLLSAWAFGREGAIDELRQESGGWTPQVVFPYVMRVTKTDHVTVAETYHFWCFGPSVALPWTCERPETDGLVLGGVRPRIVTQPEEPMLLKWQD